MSSQELDYETSEVRHFFLLLCCELFLLSLLHYLVQGETDLMDDDSSEGVVAEDGTVSMGGRVIGVPMTPAQQDEIKKVEAQRFADEVHNRQRADEEAQEHLQAIRSQPQLEVSSSDPAQVGFFSQDFYLILNLLLSGPGRDHHGL